MQVGCSGCSLHAVEVVLSESTSVSGSLSESCPSPGSSARRRACASCQRALARRRAKAHPSSGTSVRSRTSMPRSHLERLARHPHLVSTLPPRPTIAAPSDCAGRPMSSTYRPVRDSRCGFRPSTSTSAGTTFSQELPHLRLPQLVARLTSSMTEIVSSVL